LPVQNMNAQKIVDKEKVVTSDTNFKENFKPHEKDLNRSPMTTESTNTEVARINKNQRPKLLQFPPKKITEDSILK